MDKSGALEKKELHSVMQALGLNVTEAQFQYYALALMKDYDKDKSATMEFKEFKKFYSKCLATEELKERRAPRPTLFLSYVIS